MLWIMRSAGSIQRFWTYNLVVCYVASDVANEGWVGYIVRYTTRGTPVGQHNVRGVKCVVLKFKAY